LDGSIDSQTTKVWNRTFVLLLVINGVQSMGFQILVPNLPVYALRFTTSETLLGVLGASIAFSALFARPFAALFADRGNRKLIIIIGQVGMAATGLCLMLATSVFQLIVFRLIQGLLFSVVSTTVFASGIISTPKAKLGYGVSMLSLSGIGCQAVAPALGIFMADKYGYNIFFIFVSMMSVASGIVALFMDRTPVPERKEKPKGKVTIRDMIALEVINQMLLLLFFTSATSIINNFLLLYGNTVGFTGMGRYFTIFAIVLIATRLIGGSLLDRYNYGNITLVSAALCIAGLLTLANAQTFTYLIVTAIVMGIGYGYSNPTIQAEMVRRVGPDRVGAATATAYIGMDTAYVIPPIIMGMIAENKGYRLGFSAFCLPLVAAIIFILYEKNQMKHCKESRNK